MGSLGASHSGYVCIEGKSTLRAGLLSVKHRCSPGRRRTRVCLATQDLLHIPSPSPDTSHAVQSKGTRSFCDINRPTLACHALAGGEPFPQLRCSHSCLSRWVWRTDSEPAFADRPFYERHTQAPPCVQIPGSYMGSACGFMFSHRPYSVCCSSAWSSL